MGGLKRQRTKTFTGCWTCRSRRVKCDEQKPCCAKCSQFGVPCEGYGVRLTWLTCETGDGQSRPSLEVDEAQFTELRRSRRGFGDVEATLVPRWPSPEIDAMLKEIDDCPVGGAMAEYGGFSVFASRPGASSSDRRTPGSLDTPELAAETAPATAGARSPEAWVTPEQSALRASSYIGEKGGETTTDVESTYAFHCQESGSIAAGTEPPERGDRNTTRASLLADVGDAPAVQHLRRTGTRTNACKPDNVPRRSATQVRAPSHLDLLQMPAYDKRLIHHWVTFTSGHLVLIDEPDNPCRTMMLPMALRGLMSSAESSNADIATFHAICACAAYNLFELGGRQSDQDLELAWKHDQQAIYHLRHDLTQADQHRDQSCAMAIMACITIEAISGTTGRWRAHVEGGLAYLTKLRAKTAETDISKAFQSHMVAMAILCDCEVSDELKSFLRQPQSLELSFPYYGVSSSFLRNQDHMNILSASKECADQAELDAFELQLYLDFPSTNGRTFSPPNSATLLNHMAQAFYYASLVFFQRSVRAMSLAGVQTLVESGLRQLEAIESVSKGSAGSVMMWPALVLGAECGTPELQARMQRWFQQKRKLGFRNVVVLSDLVGSLWSSREAGEVDKSWQSLIAEDRFDVFRL